MGRSHEVEVLASALDSACAGRGGLVYVVGEAGIGKSRLAQEAVELATAREMRVLRGRAVPGSGAAAFRPLTEALTPAVAEMDGYDDLTPWLPALRAILPSVTSAPPVEVTAPVRGEAVLRLLSAVCSAGGLVVLEDLHWADPETVALVEHLADNFDRAPALCVVTLRTEEDGPARDLLARMRARRAVPVLELERLNQAQVSAMVFSCAGGADPEVSERVVSFGEGVPFLVEEMLLSPGLPVSLAEGVHARLARLAEQDRRVLVGAAAFGRHFDWRMLPAASGLSEAEVVDALDQGVAAQLLSVVGDGFRFRHALTAEAVFHSVSPPRRVRFAAAALAALSDPDGEVPSESRETAALVAERAGESERAGRLQLALGGEALGRGALQTALYALTRATTLLPDGDERDGALVRLVDVLVEIGRVDEALVIGGDLVARLPDDRVARLHVRLAAAAVTAARWGIAAEQVAAARRLVGTERVPSLEAELALHDGEIALGTGDLREAEEGARTALDIAAGEGLGDIECAALQLLGRCARRSSLADAETWFRRALSAAEAHGLAVGELRARHELGTIALLDRSDVDDLLYAQQLAESLGAMATAATLDIEIAAGLVESDLAAAVHHGEQAVRRGHELGLDLVVAWGWQHVAASSALRGDDERAEAARAAAVRAAPGNRDMEGFVVGGQLLAALARDDLAGALELATQMTDLLRGSPTAAPAHHRAAWPVLLAHARRPEAAAAIEELEESGAAVNRGAHGWLRMAEAILLGRTEPAAAARTAAEADAALEHMPLWRSLARRIAAEAAATDQWYIPAGWMTEAEITLRELGHHRAADACRRFRGAEIDGLPSGWLARGITRREADVLVLVVDGCSNREIAERLYLSVRTVEKHVESLLRKTATRSRTQLARAVSNT